jgi:hypothetical protein
MVTRLPERAKCRLEQLADQLHGEIFEGQASGRETAPAGNALDQAAPRARARHVPKLA